MTILGWGPGPLVPASGQASIFVPISCSRSCLFWYVGCRIGLGSSWLPGDTPGFLIPCQSTSEITLFPSLRSSLWLFKFKQASGNVYCKHALYVLVETLSGFNPLSPVPGVTVSFSFTNWFWERVVAKDSWGSDDREPVGQGRRNVWEARIGGSAVSPEPFIYWDWWLRWPQTRRA